jgi:PTH1 family peptidyl-tRNA hydrolase
MLLFVGLGNPGREYSGHRHNIGTMALDSLAHTHRAPAFRSRFHGDAAEVTLAGERVLLLKPKTYMNDSGRSVGEAARFLKIPLANIVVFHDELDLPPGRVRVKTGGGNAGHNGLRSISAHLGNDYRRVRLGIGHPGDKALVHPYVLSDFFKAERPWVEALRGLLAANAALIAEGRDAEFQNRVHLGMEAAGFCDPLKRGEAGSVGDG